MRMTVQDALSILNIHVPPITRELIKQSYRRLASKYHPDKNPDGLRLMQDVNVAYERLTNTPDHLLNIYSKPKEKPREEKEPPEWDYFRSCGLCVWNEDGLSWVDGKTFSYREVLKHFHYRWNPDRKAWWREL